MVTSIITPPKRLQPARHPRCARLARCFGSLVAAARRLHFPTTNWEELMARAFVGFIVASALVAGCASAPKSRSERSQLRRDAAVALQEMVAKDPTIPTLLDQAAGYIVFPEIKQGGFVVGGGGGTGVIYERGKPAGFAELSQASVGAQVGGQRYAELIIVRDKFTLDKIKAGSFDVGGQASAVILKGGAASATQFGNNGVAIVVNPIGGAMLNASITGQQIKAKM
jgi:lipid-binding SYLF domain-containing protein